MPVGPNKLSQFWQDLKRRNVVRVITVYAGAAFVIIELINNITEPLHLPEWTPTLVIVLLAIGFPIAIIFSWIYDVHPEGGIVKTEPVEKVSEESVLPSSKGWKIASYISFVVIVALIVLNIIPRSGDKKVIDKSIAVLPFRNESSDDDNTYFINGVMESILDNLSRIEDLRVISRNSVEKYRDDPKLTPVVAEEMDVGYVLEGSGQKVGNRLLLSLQLIAGDDDRHIWSKQYDREIEKVEELIDIQKEVAQLVVEEIEAIITPAEKLLIEKIPTTNLTAYDSYQRGREEHYKNNFERAEVLYREALGYDSTFAQAYIGLGELYSEENYWDTYFDENFLDSALILANTAISFDDQLAEAYVLRGDYYRLNNRREKAIKEYDKAIKINPNEWRAYFAKGALYNHEDLVKAIDNLYKAALLHRGSSLNNIFRRMSFAYSLAGFKEKANFYEKEALKMDRDSAAYYGALATNEHNFGDFKQSIEFAEKSYAIDSTYHWVIYLIGLNHLFLRQFEEYIVYMKKWDSKLKAYGIPDEAKYRIGYAYWLNGLEEEGTYFINQELENYNKLARLDRFYFKEPHNLYHTASIYAFLGEKDNTYENLHLLSLGQMLPQWVVSCIKNDPMLDNFRDEPEFQQIVRDVEAKYQAEHERVRQWLEHNDML